MRLLSYCIIVFTAASGLIAQESRGVVLGRISDPSGAAVAGAKIHAVNRATNTGASSVTNHEGNYEIPFLIPGIYNVSAEVTGFKKAIRNQVEVNVDDRAEVDMKLELGDVSQSVVVTAEAVDLDVTNPSLGLSVNAKELAELPVAGGNPFYLARLAAGVNSTGGHSPGNPFDTGHASTTIIVNGTRTGSSEVSLDGASNMSGNTAAYSPPQDLVQEVKVQTLAFDASLGHGTGAIVNVSIKSGTNSLHGTGYGFDSRIRANPWFYNNWLYNPATGPVTPEKIKQAGGSGWLHQRWGGTASGPLIIPHLYNGKNRTFWIVGYEGMYVRRTPTFTGTVPTLAEREGDFSSLLKIGSRYQVYDPATIKDAGNGTYLRQPLPGNLIPASRISPIARNILSYYPKPNTTGTIDGQNNYFLINSEDKDYRSTLARIDQTFSERHRMFLRINQSFYRQTVQTLPTVALGDVNDRGIWGAVLDDVFVINPRMLLNLRYGFTYQNPTTRRFSQGFDITTLGLPQSLLQQINQKADPSGLAFPEITVTGFTSLGTNGGSQSTTNYHSFFGTLTRLSGNHSLRFGAEYRVMRENGYNYGNVAPNFDFAATYTRGPNQNSAIAPIGQELASLLFGLPTGGQITVNASRAEQSTFTGMFIQDDWRISRRLTLNIGLRYEYEGPTTERFNRSIRGFDFAVASPVEVQAKAAYAKAPTTNLAADQFRVVGGVTFPGVNSLPRQLWNGDRNNFAPRIGLAWHPLKNTVIRTGYGIFYGLMGIDRQDVNQGGFNQITPLIPTLNNGVDFKATLANPFPDGIQAATGSSQGLLTQLGKAATYFDENPRNHYMQRWTLSMQRQFAQRIVGEITYVGNRGTKLSANRQLDAVPRQYQSASMLRDQATIDFLGAQVTNPFFSIPEFAGTTLGTQRIARSQLLRPYPQFTGITANLPLGYSYYHAMQIQVQKRFSRGVSFQTGYTWSKFMEATAYLNPTDDRPEKVISDQDYPHRFVVSGIAELPFGRGKKVLHNAGGWLNVIIGGWQAQGWYEGQSGQPMGFGNAIFTGNLHDIPLPVVNRNISRWFNIDAGFERNAAKVLGSNLRSLSSRFNDVRSDGTNNLDFSMFKTFRLSEKFKVQLRAESYNTLNHAQFANPNTTPTSTAFGTITAEKGHGQRQITFALKVLF